MDIATLNQFLNAIAKMDTERNAIALAAFDELQFQDTEVANEALRALESREAAARWFTGSIPSLRGEMPLSLVVEGKRDLVINTLKAIEYGMYT